MVAFSSSSIGIKASLVTSWLKQALWSEGDMEKGTVKLVVFNDEDFGYWKNQTHNYLLSQGRAMWKIVHVAYVIPTTLDNATQGELQRYEIYKALNLITTDLSQNVYDRVTHLEIAHNVWFKLCNTYEGSSEIKSSRKDTYNRQYQTLTQKPVESLDDCFAHFESIISNFLHILIMNVLNNFRMLLMILFGAWKLLF
jgi:hypothetical protein